MYTNACMEIRYKIPQHLIYHCAVCALCKHLDSNNVHFTAMQAKPYYFEQNCHFNFFIII